MKILFYIESHPIRCSHTMFLNIVNMLKPVVAASNESQETVLLVNSQTADYIRDKCPELLPHIIRIPDARQKAIDKVDISKWDQKSFALWLELMNGDGVSEFYIELFYEIYAEYQMDAIVYWGSNGAIRKFSRRTNIPAINMELGCSRSPHLESVVFDPVGVNGDSVHSQLHFQQLKQLLDDMEVLSKYDTEFFASEADLTFALRFRYSEKLKEQIQNRSEYSRVVFIPLQLHDDANLLRFSPYNSMLEFLQSVLPVMHEQNMLVIVKEHPAANQRIQGREIGNELSRYLSEFENVVFFRAAEYVDNVELINLSDVVVTVNSSLGFEATYYRKPVVVMGDACYKLKGVFPAYQDYFVNGDFELDAYLEKIMYLKAYFALVVLHDKSKAMTPDYFYNTLNTVVLAWNAAGKDAAAYAEKLILFNQYQKRVASLQHDQQPIIKPVGSAGSRLNRLKRYLIVNHPRTTLFLKRLKDSF